jgi:hypothetical protein
MTGQETVGLLIYFSAVLVMIGFGIWQKFDNRKAVREWEAQLKAIRETSPP